MYATRTTKSYISEVIRQHSSFTEDGKDRKTVPGGKEKCRCIEKHVDALESI